MGEGSSVSKGGPHSSATVSQVVRVFMALRRESHDDVAQALGITRPAVSARMNGRTAWQLGDLDLLAQHYGVPADTFLRPQPADVLDQLRGGLLDPIGRRRRQDRSGDRRSAGGDARAALAAGTGVSPATRAVAAV